MGSIILQSISRILSTILRLQVYTASSFTALSYGAIVATTVFSVMGVTVLVGSALASPGGYPDPFLPYADLRPGQPISVLMEHSCYPDYFADLYHKTCSFYPTNEIFSKVTVVKSGNIIETVTFYSENLQVVDIVRHWGTPNQVIQNGMAFNVTWEQGIATSSVSLHYRFSYQLPIQYVTIAIG